MRARFAISTVEQIERVRHFGERAGSHNGSARIARCGCDGYGPALRLEVQVSTKIAAAGS
jgi:hypothetical protein